jgi:hypothetical protein
MPGPIPDERGGVIGHGSQRDWQPPRKQLPQTAIKLRRSAGFGPDRREQRRGKGGSKGRQNPSFAGGVIVDLGSKFAALHAASFCETGCNARANGQKAGREKGESAP